MSTPYGSSGPPAATAGDLRAGEALVGQVLDAVAADPRSMRSVAADAEISPSTITRWARSEVIPRTGHLIGLAIEVGLRLQWSPLDPEWPGAKKPPTKRPPQVEEWWGGGAWRRHLTEENSNEVSPAYLAALLGAEVRWWRLARARRSLEAMSGVNPKTWADFENGPERDWFRRSKPRLVKSAPLTTAVYIGRQAGLSLEVVPLDSPWRVPPWVVAGPPGRVRTPSKLGRSFLIRK